MARTLAGTAAFNPRSRTALPADIRLMNHAANLLALVGVLALCGVALLWFSRQPAFAIRAIRIDGDVTRNSVSTIRANAAPNLTGNFLTLDLVAARRAFEAVPWVRRAVVSRVWPNRLAVRLEEHRPVALWGSASTTEKLVNSFGEIFEANVGDVEDDDLPSLQGPDGSSAHVFAMWQRLNPAFAPLDSSVAELSLSERGSWLATLDSGATTELGRGSDDEIVARTALFIKTLPQVTQRYRRPLEHADLRHHDGYAVRLKGITTTSVAMPAAKPRK